MKKITIPILAVILVLFTASFSFLPKGFEGTINYEIEYVKLPSEMAGMKSALPSNSKMVFLGSKSKIVQEVMGGSQVIISDNALKSGDMLMAMMGQKIHVHMKPEEMAAEKERMGSPSVTLLKDSKTIMGYTCKHARLEFEGLTTEVWYTDEIDARHQEFDQVEGFPLEYTTEQGGMKMKFTVTSIDEGKVAQSEFEVPEGFKTYTMQEFTQMMGGY